MSTASKHEPAGPGRSRASRVDKAFQRAGRRMDRALGKMLTRMDEEAERTITYLNDEVVPAIRNHSTRALRIASQKLNKLADFMEEQKRRR